MSLPLFMQKFLIRLGVAPRLPAVQRRLEGGAAGLRFWSDRLLAAPLDLLEELAGCLEAHGPETVDLACGSPSFDLLSSGSTKLPADRRGWPPARGLPELRAAVADKLLRDNQLRYHADDEVLITAGALGAVQTVLDAFVNRGDGVVLFDPCSPLYPLAVQTRRANVRWIDSWVENGRTRFRQADLARSLPHARLLVLNSPCNPTGGVLAAEDLEQIAWWAERCDVLILSDEVLERFRFGTSPVSIASLPEARSRTLTVGSVSKGHALASARVGWLAAPTSLLQACLTTAALRTPFVPTLCQQVALAALESPEASFAAVLETFRSKRDYALDRLQALRLEPAAPSGGYFLWVPIHETGLSAAAFADALRQEQQVRVVPGHLFGPSGQAHVRLSLAADDGRLHDGLNRLARFIHGRAPAMVVPQPVAAA
jgi:aspartate/methionine/tyrosine aminotransferase